MIKCLRRTCGHTEVTNNFKFWRAIAKIRCRQYHVYLKFIISHFQISKVHDSDENTDVLCTESLTNDSGLQIDHHSAGNVLSGTSLAEEGVERIITTTNGLVRRHLAIGLDTVLKTVQLPTGIAHLDTGLADMDRNNLTLQVKGEKREGTKKRLLTIMSVRDYFRYVACVGA